jgi:hypothetical protein
MPANPSSLRRVFQEVFCAADLAQPLPSFDAPAPAEQVRAIMSERAFTVAGIRREGMVCGFVEASDLCSGCCGDATRTFDEAYLVAGSLPLAGLVLRLKDVPRLFVATLGQVAGVVGRADLEQPPARMWLFGMITLIEMRFGRMIEALLPCDAWTPFISEARVQKCRDLLAERMRRDQTLTLADCLQFSDKAQIIARHEPLRSLTRFTSRRQVEEVGKRLEKLRNNLAHAQEIVASDWETIVALAENLDSILDGPSTTSNSNAN